MSGWACRSLYLQSFLFFNKTYPQIILLSLLWLNQLSLRDFIIADHSLSAAFKAVNFFASLFQMFLAHSGIHSFSPKFKTRFFQCRTHQFNDFRFADSELKLYGFKRRSVFPRHFDDSVDLLYVEVFIHFFWFLTQSPQRFFFKILIIFFVRKGVSLSKVELSQSCLKF